MNKIGKFEKLIYWFKIVYTSKEGVILFLLYRTAKWFGKPIYKLLVPFKRYYYYMWEKLRVDLTLISIIFYYQTKEGVAIVENQFENIRELFFNKLVMVRWWSNFTRVHGLSLKKNPTSTTVLYNIILLYIGI